MAADPISQNDELPLTNSTISSGLALQAGSPDSRLNVGSAETLRANGQSDSVATTTDHCPSSDVDTREDEPESSLWLLPRDQATVAILAVLLLIGLTAKWFIAGLTDQPAIVEHPVEYRVNLNTASWIEISQLKGIGPTLAKRIVESRSESGPFLSVDDVQRVDGIGSKKLEANRAWISVEPRE